MGTITIYRYKHLHPRDADMRMGRRWPAREAIEGFKGEVLEDTAVEVHPSAVGANGMTVPDFDPRATEGTGPNTGCSWRGRLPPAEAISSQL
jgi:hypothetical protein